MCVMVASTTLTSQEWSMKVSVVMECAGGEAFNSTEMALCKMVIGGMMITWRREL